MHVGSIDTKTYKLKLKKFAKEIKFHLQWQFSFTKQETQYGLVDPKQFNVGKMRKKVEIQIKV